MRRLQPHVMLVIAAVAVACAFACVFLPGPVGVRVPFGLALLLVLPGYAIWSALFPHRREDPVRTVTFSVGLSVVVAIIAGVEIGAYDLYSTEAWAGLMAGVTVFAALIARARRPEALARPSAPRTVRRRVRFGATATGVAALLVIGVAIGVARTPLPVPDDRGYTEFSLGQTAVGAESISLRIASSEAARRTFRLTVEAPGRAPDDRSIVIDPGEVVVEQVAVPDATGGAIIASLRDASAPQHSPPYRLLRIGLPVQGPAPGAAEVVDGGAPGR